MAHSVDAFSNDVPQKYAPAGEESISRWILGESGVSASGSLDKLDNGAISSAHVVKAKQDIPSGQLSFLPLEQGYVQEVFASAMVVPQK